MSSLPIFIEVTQKASWGDAQKITLNVSQISRVFDNKNDGSIIHIGTTTPIYVTDTYDTIISRLLVATDPRLQSNFLCTYTNPKINQLFKEKTMSKKPVMTTQEELAEMLAKQYVNGVADGIRISSNALTNSLTQLLPDSAQIQSELLAKIQAITVPAPTQDAPAAPTEGEQQSEASTPATPPTETESSPS